MTRQMIEITFGNAMTQARQLDSCADTMIKIARTDLPDVRSDLQAAWEGSNANAFIGKMDLTAGNIVKTAQKLYKIADTLRSVARTFRTAELKALEIAEKRDHG